MKDIFLKLKKIEYKMPSIFGVLVILTIIFVLIIVKVQYDPTRGVQKVDQRSPTGTIQ